MEQWRAKLNWSHMAGDGEGVCSDMKLGNGQELSWWHNGKELTCQYRRHKRSSSDSWVHKIPWRRKWQPTPVFLPGKSHGQRSLAGYSPWGPKESDRTEHAGTNWVHDLGWPWPESSSRRALGPGIEVGSWQREHEILATDQWSVTRPWLLQERIHTKRKSSETSRGFIKRKNEYSMDRHMGQTQSHTTVVVYITYMWNFFWFSFDWSFWFFWFTVRIWYASGSSRTCVCIS